jgi:hypothetical protein
MTRVALLPHVFVAGHRSPPPFAAYVSGRTLRAAVVANAALITFAGDDGATRAPGGHDPSATAHAPDSAAAVRAHSPHSAPAHAPDTPGRDIAA